MFKKSILDNGLRVVTVEKPDSHSIAAGVFIKAGSRNETKKENGISHFLEHMVFKGTRRFPTQLAVSEAIEGVGGQLNAWTDQDHTFYWNRVPTTRLIRSLTVLSELIQHPLLKEEDLEREKGVIVEEINRRNDDPATHVVELMIATLWPDQPLGFSPLGSKETVTTFTRKTFTDYLQRWYEPRNMVLVVAGKTTHGEVVSEAEKLFSSLKIMTIPAIVPAKEVQNKPRQTIFPKKTDQAHLMIGFHALPHNHPDRYAFDVMNTILGGGMSSRLFMRIREEKGLAYHIASYDEYYDDTGGLFIQSGLNLGKLEHAVEAIVQELLLIKKEPVGKTELVRVKEHIKGTIDMSVDSTQAMATWFGKGVLFGDEKTPQEVIKEIDKVTIADVQRVAQKIFTGKRASLALIGPVKKNRPLAKQLEVL